MTGDRETPDPDAGPGESAKDPTEGGETKPGGESAKDPREEGTSKPWPPEMEKK